MTEAKDSSKTIPEKMIEICFVIMPFGIWFNDYYSDIYVPAIQDAKMKPFRSDDLFRPSNIVNDIWSLTQKAKVILADMSGKNANVFYELGLAHAIAKPVILITDSIDDVPFDLRALRIIEYNKNRPNWGDILQKRITQSIIEVLESPFSAIPTAFLSVSTESKQKSVPEQEKLILEMRRDIDLLRNEIYRSGSFISNEPFSARLSSSDMHSSRIVPIVEPDSSKMRAFIEKLLSEGLNDEDILIQLRRFDIPRDWILGTINEYRKRSKSRD